ncbi:hypothetical protein BQ8482_380290 [Mesorhizobium delmotii]|uniref:Uncharacterized protein n=1 Tax=Mesorhizobium delmotii TaxID=1631247 RepID=A0A2P9ASN3_9HYPH|nr:hypothetical protein BQ8482_380290 [Mesorhizobium delmotii]
MNACANVGKATLAMLIPSEDSNIDNERLASAHRTEGARSGFPATARPASIGFNMNSVFWRLLKRSCQRRSPLPNMAEDASFALNHCV